MAIITQKIEPIFMVTEHIAMNNFCYPLYLYKNDPLKLFISILCTYRVST
jgi:hypothetical protein